MKAYVTGAAGFVGRILCEHLEAAGHEVLASDRSTGGPDLVDRIGVAASIGEARPEVIFHLAGQSHVPTSWSDPIGTLRANVEGTQNVVDAAFTHGVRRVLAVTSAEVYGRVEADHLPVSESAALQPTNPYAASKVGADAVAQQAVNGRGQDVIRLRAFNHMGPGQSTGFVASGLAQRIVAAERGEADRIPVGTLDVRRDFTDVRDVVRAYAMVAEDGEPGAVYNVCSGIDRPISDLVDGLLAHSTFGAAGRSVLWQDPDLVRPVDVPVMRGDNARLCDHTGWAPVIAFDQSMADILEDARARC